MRKVTYSMGTTLDGFVEDADGNFDWGEPDEDVFQAHLDEISQVGVHLLGRRLYETMLYWETADAGLTEAEREWGRRWRALPKVVFSRTLTEVTGSNTRLATGTLAEEVGRLREDDGYGDVAVGGALLAAEVAALGLLDEYRAMVYPVLVGGGKPFIGRDARHVPLDLVEVRTFSSGVVHLHHRVRR